MAVIWLAMNGIASLPMGPRPTISRLLPPLPPAIMVEQPMLAIPLTTSPMLKRWSLPAGPSIGRGRWMIIVLPRRTLAPAKPPLSPQFNISWPMSWMRWSIPLSIASIQDLAVKGNEFGGFFLPGKPLAGRLYGILLHMFEIVGLRQ